jgi:hypothetical protein
LRLVDEELFVGFGSHGSSLSQDTTVTREGASDPEEGAPGGVRFTLLEALGGDGPGEGGSVSTQRRKGARAQRSWG